MFDAKVTGLRSVELGVPNLRQAIAFYTHVWGLNPILAEDDSVYLRANGSAHHVLTLRERSQACLLEVRFATTDKKAVDALHAKAKSFGVDIVSDPVELPRSAGSGYGFQFCSPDGHLLSISSDVVAHPNIVNDSSKPNKLSHVVLNSANVEQQTKFFVDLLGFRLSDSTDMMDFIRCSADHHSVALARGQGPSVNHISYEFADIDGLMRGAGRLKAGGFNSEWGLGRHGPGNNVFMYFVEPNGFVVEYTTELEQIDEATFMPRDAKYWREFPLRPCRWGMATQPSNRVLAAFSGDMSVKDPADGKRCEEIMAQTLAR
jgi:catechol 2,3-dioxygenase